MYEKILGTIRRIVKVLMRSNWESDSGISVSEY